MQHSGARIAIVTDSAACVPVAQAREFGIKVIPYRLVWDGQTYRDGEELTPGEFYGRFRNSPTHPTTAQPSLDDFLSAYRRAAQWAEGVVSIHIPEKLTSAIQMARMAAEQVGDVPVRVVDAQTAAAAEGFVVLAAARAAHRGGDLDQVVSAAHAASERAGIVFTLPTLEHLNRGGRIGQAAALLGSRLRIHPVLNLDGASVRVSAVARSRQGAKERMLALVERRAASRPMHASVFHADAVEEAVELGQEVQQRFHCLEFHISEFTPVMGAHTGPGTLGVAYLIDESD